jgi:hypothetical protein
MAYLPIVPAMAWVLALGAPLMAAVVRIFAVHPK